MFYQPEDLSLQSVKVLVGSSFFPRFLIVFLSQNKHWSGGRRTVDSSKTFFATRLRGERGDASDDEQGSSDDTGDARGDITAGLSRSRFLVNLC